MPLVTISKKKAPISSLLTLKCQNCFLKMSNFKLVGTAKINELTCVKKYHDDETGFTVDLINTEGPVVDGFFVLPTEAHDDDGLPHTLEHLIFLGSEKYLYKDVLDILPNRCFASGTNAWTSTDHTCYTLTTAGSDGFLNLIPEYLDHILYPTLTVNTINLFSSVYKSSPSRTLGF